MYSPRECRYDERLHWHIKREVNTGTVHLLESINLAAYCIYVLIWYAIFFSKLNVLPMSLTECRTEADIAFLLDGSGSVIKRDFTIMKNFVKKMVRPFVGKDTQVKGVHTVTQSIAQTQRNRFWCNLPLHPKC